MEEAPAPANFTPTQQRMFAMLRREGEPLVFDEEFVDERLGHERVGLSPAT